MCRFLSTRAEGARRYSSSSVVTSSVTRGFSFSFSHRRRRRRRPTDRPNQRNYEQRRDKSSPKYTSIYGQGGRKTPPTYNLLHGMDQSVLSIEMISVGSFVWAILSTYTSDGEQCLSEPLCSWRGYNDMQGGREGGRGSKKVNEMENVAVMWSSRVAPWLDGWMAACQTDWPENRDRRSCRCL